MLTLLYYEVLKMNEIGCILKVTESRVCQIHTKAIFQLKGKLDVPQCAVTVGSSAEGALQQKRS